MASTIQVDKITDIGGNTIISSNGSGTFTSNLPASAPNVSTATGTLPIANGGTGAATLTGGFLKIPNYTFGNGITFMGSQKTIGSQQIANNALTLISFGNNTVFKNNDPDFGTIQTESDSLGIKASEIYFLLKLDETISKTLNKSTIK